MLFFELAVWWYSSGWLKAGRRSLAWTDSIWRTFSAAILIRTMFAPWRRITTTPGRALDTKLRAMVDNFISRVIGFITRTLILLAAMVLTGLVAIGGLAWALAWPLLPMATIYCLLRTITG